MKSEVNRAVSDKNNRTANRGSPCPDIGRIVAGVYNLVARLVRSSLLPRRERTEVLPAIQSQGIVAIHTHLASFLHDCPDAPRLAETPFVNTVQSNMVSNFRLWHWEDEVRRTDIPDAEVASLKRRIDKENQARNTITEQLDDMLATQLPTTTDSLPFHSETPGSIIDRLAIISLKIYHMEIETTRRNASPQHTAVCKRKLEELVAQRQNLASALDALLLDLFNGRKRLILYRAHKMYNDPQTNPALYKT